MYCLLLTLMSPKVNLIAHFYTLKDFKHTDLWSLLAPLMGEMDLCARGLFHTKFNSEQLSLEAFFDVMRTFDSDESQSEFNFQFLYIIRVFRRLKMNIMKRYRKFPLTWWDTSAYVFQRRNSNSN